MLLSSTLVDVAVVAPGAFVLGILVGYIIRARYNGKGDKHE